MEVQNSLNQRQKKAVEHQEGPLLVLAGAGAGKTKVITHRILGLIKKGVRPQNILAVTFTNKAANEMRDRVFSLLRKNVEETGGISRLGEPPFVSTFHSLGVHILRANAQKLEIPRTFSIFDRTDSLRAIKEAMQRSGINPKEFEPRKILGAISKQKGNAVPFVEYREIAHGDFFASMVSEVWEKYESIIRNEKAFDFDDLLLKTLLLLKKEESVRNFYQNLWQYIHIDEYQDTNTVQHRITNILAKPQNNLCVVGDIDQNIYSWRGADIENILSFEKTYPDAQTILLEQNYRSTKTILEVSNEIIKKNKNRKEKNLFTQNPQGEKITLAGLYDETEEANFVAEQTQKEIREGTAPKEIAVLYRANFQSRALEEAFLTHEIPYQVLGVKFFERKEVKDILAWIRASLNERSLNDMKRIVQAPPRGIGKVTFLKMAAEKEDTLPAKAKQNVNDFYQTLVKIKEYALKEKTSKTVSFVLSISGLEAHLKSGSEDDLERLENIRELVTLSTRYDILPPEEGIEKLLEDAALATDQDELKEDRDAVKLMTVHAAKGLEFDTVFITGLEEGLFPHQSLTKDRIDDEEERRLFYVALTRAKRKLFLTYTSMRTIFGSREANILSEFITDIDEKDIDVVEHFDKEREEATIYIN